MNAPPHTTVPAEAPRHRRRAGVVGPLLLIFVGGVFLLQNFGALPPDTWKGLWRLWPLVLVLYGLELLLGSRIHWALLTVIIVGLFGIGLVGTPAFLPMATTAPTASPTSFETSLQGATQADVTVRFGAGELDVGAIEDNRPDLIGRMEYQGPTELVPEERYTTAANGMGRLEYSISGTRGPTFGHFGMFGDRSGSVGMDVQLTPTIPMALNIQAGAAEANVDLSLLKVSSLELSMGAASCTLTLPAQAGTTTAHISGGAASIDVHVPPGVAAQIRHRGGLSAVTVDESRFPRVADQPIYRSPDYDQATNKVDLSIETGVASVRVS